MILQVGSALRDWGGIERYLVYLSNGLTERGHEVMVTCPPGSPLDQKLVVARVPLKLRGKYNPATILPYLKLFRSRRFDVVNVHYSPDYLMPGWAAKITGQPNRVLTRHVAVHWPERKVRLYGKLYNRFIAVSGSVKKHLVESGIDESRVIVAKAGVPKPQVKTDPQQVRTSLGLSDSDLAIGYFGRLDPEKGVETLAEASRSLAEGRSVQVYGRGPLALKLAASQSPSFKIRGFVDSVYDAMNAMDAIVVPSTWEEAFPYSVLEAMSLGKAVIASNVGGLPEIVQEGVTGFLVPKADPSALATCLNSLDREALHTLGTNARAIQESEYTLANMAARIESAYR